MLVHELDLLHVVAVGLAVEHEAMADDLDDGGMGRAGEGDSCLAGVPMPALPWAEYFTSSCASSILSIWCTTASVMPTLPIPTVASNLLARLRGCLIWRPLSSVESSLWKVLAER